MVRKGVVVERGMAVPWESLRRDALVGSVALVGLVALVGSGGLEREREREPVRDGASVVDVRAPPRRLRL